MNLISAFYRVW